MSKLGNIDFAGESGKMYTFNVYSIDNNAFTPQGGVYVVTKRSEKPDGKIVHKKLFIGSANDFTIAFRDHPKKECFTAEEANCICTFWEDSPHQRESLCEDLIDSYHPPCNE